MIFPEIPICNRLIRNRRFRILTAHLRQLLAASVKIAAAFSLWTNDQAAQVAIFKHAHIA
jgi:hypothetical protein